MSEELEVHVFDPEHVGQLPQAIYAILQTGVFRAQPCAEHRGAKVQDGCAACIHGTGGKKKTVIELTHNKGRVDHAVELVKGYGEEGRTYRVYYGRIVWEAEGDVVPEAAPVQQLFDPGVRWVDGKKYIGDVPAQGHGKVKVNKRKVKHGED